MLPENCVLFSGAAQGAESAFGAAAERHGIDEVNFTFEGHSDARRRGIRVLTRGELRQGDVSLAYLTMQSIWHQVNQGREVFVIGRITPAQTVTGGPGVAAEFAKLFNKPVHVFDQARDGWFRWAGDAWEAAHEPVVTEPHFCGTGTRFLEDNGRAAIDGLFARTFR
ncbi:MAG: hypothetical protein E6J75_04100 [Deltaproteobacteria bacterium]|nr:MAG: hypothetical protein E6J75_04100 [Deltaproteobacteria bacterium]